MNGRSKAARADVVLAAGGIIWRDSSRGPQVAVVHRPEHDDWTLPKGKLDDGESWQDAAVREVEEETGLHVELGEFAGASSYMTNRAPKVVLYWHMHVEGDCRFAPANRREVDALEWLTVAEAHDRLTYERDRKILTEAVGVQVAIDARVLSAQHVKRGLGARIRAALHRKQ